MYRLMRRTEWHSNTKIAISVSSLFVNSASEVAICSACNACVLHSGRDTEDLGMSHVRKRSQ